MAWVLATGLKSWRSELDEVFPGRDKASSGTIGDQSHSTGTSGHNPDRTGRAEYRDGDAKDEVRATDEDADLVPGSEIDWMMRVIQWLITGLRAGRWRVVPFRYIIYRPRGSKVSYIWHVNTGWQSRVYTGSNPHDKHAHFSGGWSQAADERIGRLGLAEIRGGDMADRPIVEEKDSGQMVALFQYLLADLGYPPGEIDGEYGPKMATAVNAYRAKNTTAGPSKAITGWHAFHMLRALAAKHAGKDGAPGRPGANGAPGKDGAAGAPGRDGKDGVFTGALTITGGTLTAVTPGQEN